MDFSWTPEQKQLRSEAVAFAEKELAGRTIELDRAEQFDREGWQKCGQFGVQGLPLPRKYGGREADALTIACVLEGLGYGSRDNGLLFAINAHLWGCCLPILTFGTEEQKQQYLPRLASGEFVGAWATAEKEAGSDAYSIRTVARRENEDYVLNGDKIFVSNGPIADVVVVTATVDPDSRMEGLTAFLVDKETPGFSVKRQVSKMGLRTVPMGELSLQDCRVSVKSRLGREGQGSPIFRTAMEWERALILAASVGCMERQLEQCVEHARQRSQFGQPIGSFQQVSSKIVDLKLRLETARLLLYRTAWLKTKGKSSFLEASLTKLHLSESWVQSCLDALQIHGGYGYLTENEWERQLRDAVASRIFSGTSEIQRNIIAKLMGL